MSIQEIINTIKPGRSIRLSGTPTVWVTVERSGNGKTLRYVRHTVDTSVVFRVVNF